MTLIFAVIERTGWLTGHLSRWSPEQLPDLSDFAVRTKRKSGWDAAWGVAFSGGVILWLAGLIPLPMVWTNVKGLTLTPDPIWMTMWGPVLALMIARLVLHFVQLLRPRWKSVRAVLSVATTAGAIAVLATIYQAGHWLTASSTTLPAGRVARIDGHTNLGIHYAIIVVGVIWVFECAQELWRIYAGRR